MHAHSDIRTAQQRAATDRLRDSWMTTALSTRRCDRAAAERAVHEAYAAAGRTRPAITIWMDSPLGGVLATTVLADYLLRPRPRDLPGRVDQMRLEARTPVGHRLWYQLWSQLRGRQRQLDQLSDELVGKQMHQLSQLSHLRGRLQRRLQSLLEERRDQLDHLRDRAEDQLWTPLRDHLRGQVRDQLREQVWGRVRGPLWRHMGGALYGHLDPWNESSWLALNTRALDIAGLPPSHRLETMTATVRHTGWWWPLHGAVVLTDRPTALRRDQQGRLHCANGPALAYADGYDGHWWHGLRVPSDLVAGDGWAPERILGERNVEIRRCAIEKRGWDRFVHDAGLAQVGDDAPDPGNPGQVLRLYELPARLADLYAGAARILVVANASLDRDGTRRTFGLPVPAHIGDPITAAATTFGVDAAEYLSLARAT